MIQLSPADSTYDRDEVATVLPPVVLDFHAHTWTAGNWKEGPRDNGKALLKRVHQPRECA